MVSVIKKCYAAKPRSNLIYAGINAKEWYIVLKKESNQLELSRSTNNVAFSSKCN